MRQAAAVYGPTVEVRDVLESFLRDAVLVPDWRRTLTKASRQFIELGADPVSNDLADLGQRIGVLAQSELGQEQTLTRAVAADIESLVDRVHVPDLPRPEDPDWSF
jgi:hypothetical protein